MLQNLNVTTFAIFDLLRENYQGVKLPPTPVPTQIRVKQCFITKDLTSFQESHHYYQNKRKSIKNGDVVSIKEELFA